MFNKSYITVQIIHMAREILLKHNNIIIHVYHVVIVYNYNSYVTSVQRVWGSAKRAENTV